MMSDKTCDIIYNSKECEESGLDDDVYHRTADSFFQCDQHPHKRTF